MGRRRSCCSEDGLKKGAWTALEDKLLISYIKTHGVGKWRSLPKKAGLKRCGKSCRLRWLNYLRPDIKRGNITQDEEELIIRLHNLLGNKWSLIAGRIPGRTDNEIKNYWNTTLAKKLKAGSPNSSIGNGPISQSEEKNIVIGPAPSQKVQDNVIRTKAFRCTRPSVLPLHMFSSLDCNNDQAMDIQTHMGPQIINGAVKFSNDFMMGFNMVEEGEGEQVCMGCPPNTGFCPEIQVDNGMTGASSLFEEAMVIDNLVVNGCDLQNIGSAVGSWSCFLDVEEEYWL
ncbi:hypothetical protein AAC387_Pa09g2275 [Persea americana]